MQDKVKRSYHQLTKIDKKRKQGKKESTRGPKRGRVN